MKRDISLSIFFPAYNEEENIEASVLQALQVAQGITDTYEVIVVNDGSNDRTREISDRLALTNNRVRVVHHDLNQGYGAAVLSGIKAAQYDYVFYTDADLQFDINELVHLVTHVPEHKVVLGYRAKRQDPFIRLVNAKGWNIINRILFGLRIKDVDGAFKLFKSDVVKDIQLKSRGAMMIAELMIRLQQKGIVFKEIPVTHMPRVKGRATGAKPAVILRAFRELFTMYRGDFIGKKYVTYMQVVKFGMIGVVNTLIDVLTYVGLTRALPFFFTHIIGAKALSFLLATVFSFMMNRRFTFGIMHRPTVAEVIKFYSTVGLGIFINIASVYVFHVLLGFYDLVAVAVATLVTFGWGFVFSKFWVFKKTHTTVSPEEEVLKAHYLL